MYIESKMREWEGTRDEDKVSREKKIKEKSWEDIYIYNYIDYRKNGEMEWKNRKI